MARPKKYGRSLYGDRTYKTWDSMKQRCNNPNNDNYHSYGGRGISICQRWLNSFQNFVDDMGERPEGKTLDRKDNDGNYEPSNCRWATAIEQAKNKRYELTCKGENKPNAILSEKQVRVIKWALHYGSRVTDLAKIFNVHVITISQIKTKRSWKHVLINIK